VDNIPYRKFDQLVFGEIGRLHGQRSILLTEKEMEVNDG
jgi:hypothetical protein